MNSPVIAISCYFVPEFPIWKNGVHGLPAEYVRSVLAAGGIPVLVPPGIARAENLIDRVDGLILAGGGDIDPGRYGSKPPPQIEYVDPARDATELALFGAARSLAMPILAICRGLQLANVALGGTLHPHLAGDGHRDAENHSPIPHDVRIAPGSRLFSIFGPEVGGVASLHHQAIDSLADDLQPVGWADDGVIEAVEAANLLGVQWHPELMAATDKDQQRLFESFVTEAKRSARSAVNH